MNAGFHSGTVCASSTLHLWTKFKLDHTNPSNSDKWYSDRWQTSFIISKKKSSWLYVTCCWNFVFDISESEIRCGLIFLSSNDNIHHIPWPQTRVDTQTFAEISFLLLPGLEPIQGAETCGEDRKPSGLHWLDLWLSARRRVQQGLCLQRTQHRRWQRKKTTKSIPSNPDLIFCATDLLIMLLIWSCLWPFPWKYIVVV